MTRKYHTSSISILRILAAILIPPLAVYDKGWDKILITAVLWFLVWPAGMAVALYFLLSGTHYDEWKADQFGDEMDSAKPKREAPVYDDPDDREYIELADGEVLEVVDPEDEERQQRLSR